MKNAVRALLAVILVLGFVCGALAQEVRSFHGRFTWVQGTTMAFAPDVGGSFEVDVSKVDQKSYQDLKSGDRVTVGGVVTDSGNKLIAKSITPDR